MMNRLGSCITETMMVTAMLMPIVVLPKITSPSGSSAITVMVAALVDEQQKVLLLVSCS
jgi:hypothetical protein